MVSGGASMRIRKAFMWCDVMVESSESAAACACRKTASVAAKRAGVQGDVHRPGGWWESCAAVRRKGLKSCTGAVQIQHTSVMSNGRALCCRCSNYQNIQHGQKRARAC